MTKRTKHSEILDIIGYGLSKFAGMTRGKNNLIQALGFSNQSAFSRSLVQQGIISTSFALKNRQDNFDSFFENTRAGWKTGDKLKTYSQMKNRIDSVLGHYSITEFAVFVQSLIKYLTTPSLLDEKTTKAITDSISAIFDNSAEDQVIITNPPEIVSHGESTVPPDTSIQDPNDTVKEERLHTEVQWLLIQLGKMTGCQVFIAKNDSKEKYYNQPISEGCLSELPHAALEDKTHRRASLIDVIWIFKRKIVCAFEIEVSTSIYSGILRMSDLAYSMPYDAIECYIVAPKIRINKVVEQLQRPTFSNDVINDMLKYISVEDIRSLFEQLSNLKAAKGALNWEIIHGYAHTAIE